jgi:hypothetical protein
VAEGARLESVYAGNRIAGSNPAPSAITNDFEEVGASDRHRRLGATARTREQGYTDPRRRRRGRGMGRHSDSNSAAPLTHAAIGMPPRPCKEAGVDDQIDPGHSAAAGADEPCDGIANLARFDEAAKRRVLRQPLA